MLRFLEIITLVVLVTSVTVSGTNLPRRLPSEVVPTNYKLNFRFESDFFNTSRFSGTVAITLNVGDITTPDSSFQLHAEDLEITSLALTLNGVATGVSFINDTQLVTVVPVGKLNPGGYQLDISYNGILSDSSPVGLYLRSYIDYFKQTKYAIASQFKETYARRAFPCFDEPSIKTPFTMTITYPKGYHAWTNVGRLGNFIVDPTDPNLEKATFDRSPTMSTYLVSVLLSEWNCKDGDKFNNRISIQLCSRITAMDKSAATALYAAPRLLQVISDFTSHNFSEIGRVILVTPPDFLAEDMGNWGIVTLKDSNLLWYENESSNLYQQKVYTSLAKVFSQQWFGNLVTVDWWNEAFLNEAFAAYFEYQAADEVQPNWGIANQFVIEQLQLALDVDSYDTSLPLTYDAANYIPNSQNDILQSKGASILRMVHHFLTVDNFKLGVSDYINNNAASTVTLDTLWSSLQAHVADLPSTEKPPAEVSTIMETWMTKPGYPLLTVNTHGADVTITQERFLLSGEADGTQWYVPITYTTSNDALNFLNTNTQAWLNPGENLTLSGVLSDADWIVLNNQQVGYYRVKYDQTLLDKISKTLSSNISTIDEMSRAQLVDDQFNFAKAGISDYDDVFKFLSFLKDDDSYYSWSSAFNNFDYLLKRIARDDVRDSLKKYIKEHMGTLLASVPSLQNTTDSHIDTLKQALAHTWACKVDDQDCVDEAYNQFMTYTNNPLEKPDRNLRSIVYCNGLRHSKDIINDFRYLWEQYEKTKIPSEQATILQALGCSNDAANRVMYLSMVLTEPSIKLQDARYVFSSVYSNSAEGVTEVLNFIIDKHAELTEHFGSTSTVTSLISTIADLITSQAQIDKLNNFSKRPDLEPEITSAIVSGVATATKNLEAISKLEKTFVTFFDITSGSVSIGGNYLINLVCLLIGYVIFNFH